MVADAAKLAYKKPAVRKVLGKIRTKRIGKSLFVFLPNSIFELAERDEDFIFPESK